MNLTDKTLEELEKEGEELADMETSSLSAEEKLAMGIEMVRKGLEILQKALANDRLHIADLEAVPS